MNTITLLLYVINLKIKNNFERMVNIALTYGSIPINTKSNKNEHKMLLEMIT